MLENLINDMMDIAKLDNKHFKLDEDYFDLNLTVLKTLDMISHQAYKQKVELRGTIDDPKTLLYLSSIVGDERRF